MSAFALLPFLSRATLRLRRLRFRGLLWAGLLTLLLVLLLGLAVLRTAWIAATALVIATALLGPAIGRHHTVIMLRVLKIVFRRHPVAKGQRIAPKGLVFLDHLIGGAADFSLRTTTFKVGVASAAATATWAASISTMAARSFRRLALLHIMISSIGLEHSVRPQRHLYVAIFLNQWDKVPACTADFG